LTVVKAFGHLSTALLALTRRSRYRLRM